MTTFKEFQAKYTPIINDYLEQNLAKESDDPRFAEIMAYSVMAGGKRLRPLLFLATLDSLGKDIDQKAVQTACGIELIHTYSLIHDDLPAMDNDDYRRGKLTSHKKWGEAEAILAGDGLLPLGIQWIAEGSQSAKLVEIITKAVGPAGMVGGQYLDIDTTNNDSVDAQTIDHMEWLKTGCLILASVEMATAFAGAAQEQAAKYLDFAKDFGRGYQLYDDLVDIVETSEEAGKLTHKDQEVGKNNSLTMQGAAETRQELKDLIAKGQAALAGEKAEVLLGFLDLYQKVL
ncbi:geranylgeranyl pyrophosphate synthase [Lactobacillus equicursoris DSM 19284 = JCM 14600 = CIP 110162]|uniref:Farnesyl diphosphate synthase n=3 Tax=Lactobacillus equicursoris TaxID=420645 RepID=A0A0R1M1T4_9LACO|nr:polyprenyl synthetase family protein [Lactobacillus equicursoris]KRL01943.1 geranylgeranyl pyrophosphate synthase [Lactobacillus equicursoris DSM 19284 = JCM 14600 = CIP 110162]MDD6407497.1 polyprenyl synthetase family protein [Lactobacillus equicursoris]